MNMNMKQYLLTCLSEECAEVIQRVSKALRFGLYEIQPGQELDNEQRIELELTDLVAVIDLLEQFGVILMPYNKRRIAEKKTKVMQFAEYSKECGILDD